MLRIGYWDGLGRLKHRLVKLCKLSAFVAVVKVGVVEEEHSGQHGTFALKKRQPGLWACFFFSVIDHRHVRNTAPLSC